MTPRTQQIDELVVAFTDWLETMQSISDDPQRGLQAVEQVESRLPVERHEPADPGTAQPGLVRRILGYRPHLSARWRVSPG